MHDSPEELLEGLFADKAIIINAAPIDGESQIIHTEPVTDRSGKGYRVSLILGQNLYDPDPIDGLYTETIHAGGKVTVAQYDNLNQALGAYLSVMEVHGVDENQAINELEHAIELEQFYDYLEHWTQEDRRKYVLDDLLEGNDDPRREPVREDGSFRTVGTLSSGQERFVTKLLGNSAQRPGQCYESAITALTDHLDSLRVAYIEGVALPKYGGSIQEHAWIEVDGLVVEPTWPWHRPTPPTDAIYFGIELDAQDVYETIEERGTYGTVLADRETMIKYFDENF